MQCTKFFFVHSGHSAHNWHLLIFKATFDASKLHTLHATPLKCIHVHNENANWCKRKLVNIAMVHQPLTARFSYSIKFVFIRFFFCGKNRNFYILLFISARDLDMLALKMNNNPIQCWCAGYAGMQYWHFYFIIHPFKWTVSKFVFFYIEIL